MVMSLLESLYKSLYKNVKDSALSIFRSPWRPEKSCVFAAAVLDLIAVSWRARPRDPFLVPIEPAPPLFVRIREDKISLKIPPPPLHQGKEKNQQNQSKSQKRRRKYRADV